MFVVADLFLVLPQLLLELLYGPVDAPPELGGSLVADHIVEMLGRGHDLHGRQILIAQVDGDVEGRDSVKIPLQSRHLVRDL